MNNYVSSKFIGYLFRFMMIFDINRFQLRGVHGKTISAKVGWADDGSPDYDEDEEVQDIEWDVQKFENMEDALILAEYLIDNRLISTDKIAITEIEFRERLGWETQRYDDALKTLLSVRVDMVDNGERTDYFFIHF